MCTKLTPSATGAPEDFQSPPWLGAGRATYRKGQSRGDLANEEVFDKEFSAQKLRLRAMQLRYVDDTDPIRQALLEIYVSVVHRTQFNDLDTY